jgi:ADP-heptose:LPS heptosyltransferase
VARRAELPAGADLTGRTGLGELAAVVAGARLVVSGDTGAAHLASAYRRPSVVLFGPESPSRWGPPEDGPHVVIAHGAGGGDPHASALDPALSRITVEEVLVAARGLLGEPVGSGSASARTAR